MSMLGDAFKRAGESVKRAASAAADAVAEVAEPTERPVRTPPPPRPFHCVLAVVKSVADDTLTCRILKTDGTECAADITVAKPQELRRTFYEGGRGDGVTYTYSSATQRTANDGDSVTQNIVPSYVADSSHVLIVTVPNGTQVDGASWLDLNVDARAWADAPA